MKLYQFPPSPNCQKVVALAYEVGTPLESVFVDIFKGGTKTPEHLARNPNAKIPVLEDGARARTILLGIASCAAFLAVGVVSSLTDSFRITKPSAVTPLVVVMAFEGIAVLIFRKRLLTNEIARKLLVIFIWANAIILMQRSARIWIPLSVDATEVRNEMFSIAAPSRPISLPSFRSAKRWRFRR